jgi:formylglycine-generating enzyme required for sulfatase activity/energy-coupling factor transporter ATP-binding protein EcfA2
MDAFAADYLASLTSDLTSKMLAAAGRIVSSRFAGTPREQALERCVYLGVAAMLAHAADLTPDEKTHLQGILQQFFAEPEVDVELAQLVRGNPLPVKNLLFLFDHYCGLETLPHIDLREGLGAFEIAFLVAATEEEALRGSLEVHALLGQKQLLEEMLAELRRLNGLVRESWAGIRADQITAQNVVNGVQLIFGGGMTLTHDWEKHYLRTLIGQCDALDLAAVDETVSLREGEGVRISDVFTRLYLDRLTRGPRETVAQALKHPDKSATQERQERLPIQAIEALAALPRLVILGQPGGGKSTLVNHLATQLAKRRLGQTVAEEMLPGWDPDDKPLPMRIILRRLAAWLPTTSRRATEGLLWGYLKHELEESGCPECFLQIKRTLIEEGGIILCDGLDEVRETDEDAKRSLIKEAIRAFAKPLAKCHVVITCREYAYRVDDAWRLPTDEFPVVELALFDQQQIAEFVTAWYRRVAGPQKGWSAVKCEDEAADLVKTIREWPHLQDLAGYPLLLTLMAQMHGRDGTLPNNRADLYERAVNLLLSHWENRIVIDEEQRRRIEPGLVVQLGVHVETLRIVLEKVAFEAHDRQEREPQRDESAADIPREDLREALEEALGGDANKAKKAIEYIQQRAGLLQDKGRRTFAFPHRTFQEYLAANYIMRQSEPERMLRERAWRDLTWWREVFLLAAGSVRRTPSNIYKLVDFLLPNAAHDAVTVQENARAQLAQQAFWETDFADAVSREAVTGGGNFVRIHRTVQDWLLQAMRADETLSPRERAEAGNALARLGDPREEVTTLDGMQFCYVPAGPFWMGSCDEDDMARESEKPLHTQHVPYGYWIGRYPVTVAQFREYVQASGHDAGDIDVLLGYENHPVVQVSWHETRRFCTWLTERWRIRGFLPDDWSIRLPTEAEWEKAARGGLHLPIPYAQRRTHARAGLTAQSIEAMQANPLPRRLYPWGDDSSVGHANSIRAHIGNASCVGCFPNGSSPYQIEDMSGNVFEWCTGKWQTDYRSYRRVRHPERDDLYSTHRAVRGGSFSEFEDCVRCAYRSRKHHHQRLGSVGFRVVAVPDTGLLYLWALRHRQAP